MKKVRCPLVKIRDLCARTVNMITPPISTPARNQSRPSVVLTARRTRLVGGRIVVVVIGDRLSPDVGGEQTLNIGKAGEITQKVAQSPGSAISSITSAHDATRLGSRPSHVSDFYFKLKSMTPLIQNLLQSAQLRATRCGGGGRLDYRADKAVPRIARPAAPGCRPCSARWSSHRIENAAFRPCLRHPRGLSC
jgi:hypothetical protein